MTSADMTMETVADLRHLHALLTDEAARLDAVLSASDMVRRATLDGRAYGLRMAARKLSNTIANIERRAHDNAQEETQ